MAYETRTQLIARLTKVDAALDSARTAERYGIGGRSLQRNYLALMRERNEILEKIEMIDRRTTGFANKVQFERPA